MKLGEAQVHLDAARKALGQLGLHEQRFIRPQPTAERTEVTISAAELTKLADAVVELETLVYNWLNDGQPVGKSPAEEALWMWARGHDFSNVTGEAPRQP